VGLEQIIDRALAKRPEHRFPSAAEFAAAMQSVLNGGGYVPQPIARPLPLEEAGRDSAGGAIPTLGTSPLPMARSHKSNLPLLVFVAIGFLVLGVALALSLVKFVIR
jgi:hypothetical protein